MCVPTVMVVQPTVVELFHSKPQNVNLVVALEEMSEDHQSGQDLSFGNNERLTKFYTSRCC